MCWIGVAYENRIPEKDLVAACRSNADGIGIAWVHGDRVRWVKGISQKKAIAALKTMPFPYIVHCRLASIGGVDVKLCHPFPTTSRAGTNSAGVAQGVVAHNGHWIGWREALLPVFAAQGKRLPPGPWSDTRAAAALAGILGPAVLSTLPGRWVHLTPKGAFFYGDLSWTKEKGRWYSAKPSFLSYTDYGTGYGTNYKYQRNTVLPRDKDWDDYDDQGVLKGWMKDPKTNTWKRGSTIAGGNGNGTASRTLKAVDDKEAARIIRETRARAIAEAADEGDNQKVVERALKLYNDNRRKIEEKNKPNPLGLPTGPRITPAADLQPLPPPPRRSLHALTEEEITAALEEAGDI